MSPASKALIIRVLENSRSDNLYRAKAAFKNYSEEQMDRPYGQSDQTPRQILAGYATADAAVDTALADVRALP